VSKRYIKDFKSFLINEQDLGLDAALGGETAAPAPKKVKSYSFIFLSDGKKVSSVGPLQKRYNLYRIRETDLDAWLDKSINKTREKLKDFSKTRLDKIKTDVKNAITGERFSLSEIDQEFMSKFKNDIKTGLVDGTDSLEHYKDAHNRDAFNSLETITVEFDKNGIPLTTDLEVTFIDTKK
jgi:hypothetical protein